MKYKIISIKDNEKKLTDIINIVGNYFAVEGLWEKDDSWNIYLSAHVKDDEILAINNFLKKNNKNSSNEVIFEVVDYDDKNIDWNAEWKKGYKLVKITEKIYVYPSWIEVPEEMGNKTVVRIDPQMGFGTGTHETTQLMMEFIEKYINEQKYILDAGTGSGILSILSEKLNKQASITAFDVDEDAIQNARINQNLNNCKNIEWLIGNIEIVNKSDFDLITANINRVVLEELIPVFVEKMKDDSLLILSGILTEEINLIKKICAGLGLTEIEFRQKNEWTAGVWKVWKDER